MKLVHFVLILILALLLTACGERVEVPPAHVGKVLTKNGYAPETIPPSKFRLSPCMMFCDKLIVLEAADTAFKETMVVFMPKDKLNLSVEVRGIMSVPTTQKIVDQIYDRVTADMGKDATKISGHKVYTTYAQPGLRGIVRSELVKYTIADVMEQREVISQAVHEAITNKLQLTKTPIIVSRFELADIQPPKVIIEAQQSAKEREIDIQKANADAEVKLVEAQKDLEIAQKQRLVDREKALAIAEQNEIAAKSITPELLAYRKLEVAEKIYGDLAKSDNVIIIPADSSGFSNINDEAILAKMLGKELRK